MENEYFIVLSDGHKHYLRNKIEFNKARIYKWHMQPRGMTYGVYRNKENGGMEYLNDFIDKYCFDRRIVRNLISKRPMFKRGKQKKRY